MMSRPTSGAPASIWASRGTILFGTSGLGRPARHRRGWGMGPWCAAVVRHGNGGAMIWAVSGFSRWESLRAGPSSGSFSDACGQRRHRVTPACGQRDRQRDLRSLVCRGRQVGPRMESGGAHDVDCWCSLGSSWTDFACVCPVKGPVALVSSTDERCQAGASGDDASGVIGQPFGATFRVHPDHGRTRSWPSSPLVNCSRAESTSDTRPVAGTRK